jgi:hypothetical protein
MCVFLLGSWSLRPLKVEAACETAFTLDWSDPTTYSVSCGSVTPSGWKVSNQTCQYVSPLFSVGTSSDGSPKQVDLSLRINQSGNLDADDSARVTIYVNGVSYTNYVFIGNNSNSVFSINPLFSVPSGGNYHVVITLLTNASNEFWTIKSGDFTTCVIENTPLPVSLVRFEAERNPEGHVLLYWDTQSESNNDYFTVSRSTNSSAFDVISKVSGVGNSNGQNQYKHYDAQAPAGLLYYRLAQTDFDGTEKMLKIISVVNNKVSNSSQQFRLRSNPFQSFIWIEVVSAQAQKAQLRLLASTGEETFSEYVFLSKGHNDLRVEIQDDFPAGIYTLVFKLDSGELFFAKAIKR